VIIIINILNKGIMMKTSIQRLTIQRQVILEELKKTKSHPTADEVYQEVRKRIPNISLGTVYRNLEILSGCGLIKKIETAGYQKRFDGNTEPHHHVRCINCGRIGDIYCKPTIPLKEVVDKACGFEIFDYWLEFIGLCPECRKKKEEQNNN